MTEGPFTSVEDTSVAGSSVVASNVRSDPRGTFARLFDREALGSVHRDGPIVQINLSRTLAVGALRGLHFQRAPSLESKWVRCLHGRVWDVVVDLRHGSPTFLQHSAVELSGEAMNAVFVPEGCAHGFQVLEPRSDLLYLHTAAYSPNDEGGLRWDDPTLAIQWPLPPVDLSPRDQSHPLIEAGFDGLRL